MPHHDVRSRCISIFNLLSYAYEFSVCFLCFSSSLIHSPVRHVIVSPPSRFRHKKNKQEWSGQRLTHSRDRRKTINRGRRLSYSSVRHKKINRSRRLTHSCVCSKKINRNGRLAHFQFSANTSRKSRIALLFSARLSDSWSREQEGWLCAVMRRLMAVSSAVNREALAQASATASLLRLLEQPECGVHFVLQIVVKGSQLLRFLELPECRVNYICALNCWLKRSVT
jgi:hypothetical protein